MALLKRLELEEKKRATNEKLMMLKIIVSLALFIGGLAMMFFNKSIVGLYAIMGAGYIWLLTLNKDEDDNLGDKAKVPSSISDFKKKNYTTIEAIFKSAGFTNVKCVPLNDLTIGVLKRPGTVESITINGHNITYGGRKFLKDAPIVISYHSFAGS